MIQNMPSNKPSSYLRFLNLIDVLDRINPGKKLDNIEEGLLNKIVLSYQANESTLVGDLISLADLGSQATLHGRLKNLSAMGYIKMVANDDGRKKEVLPTQLALKRYEEISKCLEKGFELDFGIGIKRPKYWSLRILSSLSFKNKFKQLMHNFTPSIFEYTISISISIKIRR